MKQALIVVTGAKGTGKTTFLSTYLRPGDLGRCYYIDTEYSANNVVAQLAEHGLAFGRYVNVQDRFRGLPPTFDLLARIRAGNLPWVTSSQKNALADFYQWFVDDLNEHLTQGDYDQVAVDSVEKLEAGMAAWCEVNKKEAGWSTKAFGRFWNEGVYPLYEGLLSAIYQRGVEVVTFSSHLRTPWEGDRPVPGKVAPSGKRVLYQLSQLFLWMVKEPHNADGAPAALVLKERMGRLGVDGKGDWAVQRALPRRLPVATWAWIRTYLKAPANLGSPELGEVPSVAEEEMMSEFLSDAQMRLMILDAEKELAEAQVERPIPQVERLPEPVPAKVDDNLMKAARVRDSMAPDTATPAIAEKVAEELGVPLPVAVQLVKQLPERVF